MTHLIDLVFTKTPLRGVLVARGLPRVLRDFTRIDSCLTLGLIPVWSKSVKTPRTGSLRFWQPQQLHVHYPLELASEIAAVVKTSEKTILGIHARHTTPFFFLPSVVAILQDDLSDSIWRLQNGHAHLFAAILAGIPQWQSTSAQIWKCGSRFVRWTDAVASVWTIWVNWRTSKSWGSDWWSTFRPSRRDRGCSTVGSRCGCRGVDGETGVWLVV